MAACRREKAQQRVKEVRQPAVSEQTELYTRAQKARETVVATAPTGNAYQHQVRQYGRTRKIPVEGERMPRAGEECAKRVNTIQCYTVPWYGSDRINGVKALQTGRCGVQEYRRTEEKGTEPKHPSKYSRPPHWVLP